MTRIRRRPSALALIAVVGVIGACGSVALAGTGRGSSAGDTNAVNRAKSVELADMPSPTGKLPSTAHSPVRPTAGTPAGSTSAGAPALSLPGR